MLYVFSVADFEGEGRRRRLFEVFDAHPDFRPSFVGPADPPRIRVTSMTEVMRSARLPIRYLIARQKKPHYEGGEINLHRGRGGWTGSWREGESELREAYLIPHSVQANYAADWFGGPEGAERISRLETFFNSICEVMDAFYGWVGTLSLWRQRMRTLHRGIPFPQLERNLPDVMWLNYFGPSWLARVGDRLRQLPYEMKASSTGGVTVKTTESPFALEPGADPAAYLHMEAAIDRRPWC